MPALSQGLLKVPFKGASCLHALQWTLSSGVSVSPVPRAGDVMRAVVEPAARGAAIEVSLWVQD